MVDNIMLSCERTYAKISMDHLGQNDFKQPLRLVDNFINILTIIKGTVSLKMPL